MEKTNIDKLREEGKGREFEKAGLYMIDMTCEAILKDIEKLQLGCGSMYAPVRLEALKEIKQLLKGGDDGG